MKNTLFVLIAIIVVVVSFLVLNTDGAPKGYHTVCDNYETLWIPISLDVNHFTLVPQVSCTQVHYEKDKNE